MRIYTTRHRYSCGIDLHARTMYLCVLDEHNEVVLHVRFATLFDGVDGRSDHGD